MSRRVLGLVLVTLIACKGKEPAAKPQNGSAAHPASAADAAVATMDWPGCKAALESVPSLPVTKRAQAIIDALVP